MNHPRVNDPNSFRCATGLSAETVRKDAIRLTCDYYLGNHTRILARGCPGRGTVLEHPELATYAGRLSEGPPRGPGTALVGFLAYDYDAHGRILPPPGEPSFQDGPTGKGARVAGTHLFLGIQPGRGVSDKKVLMTAIAATMYLNATTQARTLISVQAGRMAQLFGQIAPDLAVSPLATDPRLVTFEWSFQDELVCLNAGAALTDADEILFQARIALQMEPLLERIRKFGGPSIELRTF